jgi:hypothetical protein
MPTVAYPYWSGYVIDWDFKFSIEVSKGIPSGSWFLKTSNSVPVLIAEHKDSIRT